MKSLLKSVAVVISLAAFGCVVTAESDEAGAEGKILSPKEGDQVPGVYEASGTVTGLEKNQELWVVVRKGKNFWPKEQAFVVGAKKWSATVDESATKSGRPYSLVLFAVDTKGQAEIADYFTRGEETGSWPAMSGMEDSIALDKVNLRRR